MYRDGSSSFVSEYDGAYLSSRTYNLVIGGFTLYGLVLAAVCTKFFGNALLSSNYLVILLLYFGCCIAGSFVMKKESLTAKLIGYHLIVVPVGVVLSITLTAYRLSDSEIVSQALWITAGIVGAMTALSFSYPDFFSGIGRALSISLISVIIIELIASLFGASLALFDYIIIGIFALYVGYDWSRAANAAPTVNNAVSAACSIYLDIVNILLRVLSILGRTRRRD